MRPTEGLSIEQDPSVLRLERLIWGSFQADLDPLERLATIAEAIRKLTVEQQQILAALEKGDA
jgi:hypothetical protein